jgi:putative ABC transport system substrate-binding protein
VSLKQWIVGYIVNPLSRDGGLRTKGTGEKPSIQVRARANSACQVSRRDPEMFALSHHLPAASPTRGFVRNGGLISYCANYEEVWRQMAYYVVKILQGAKPSDLPVEQPTKFEFLINGKTAKALGLTIPPLITSMADDVIE